MIGYLNGITRRSFGLTISTAAVSGCDRREYLAPPQPGDSPTVAYARLFAEQHLPEKVRYTMVENARMVDRDFTTAPVRAHVAGQVYEWPANYLSPKARSDYKTYAVPGADRFELPSEGRTGIGGFSFFWPALEGFSMTNWVDLWDKRRIDYKTFRLQDIGSPTTEQMMERLHRARVIEERPGVFHSDLSGYRWVKADGSYQDRVEWIGRTEDGRLFHMHSLIPGSERARELFNPRCIVDMVDGRKTEEVFYEFSLDLFEHWREIDRGTRQIIQGWRKS